MKRLLSILLLCYLSSHAQTDFICPNRNNIIDTTSTGAALLTARCVSGNNFLIGGTSVNWELLSCSGAPTRAIRDTGRTCNNGKGQELEAGFAVDDGRFFVSIVICFNRNLQIAYYSYINQTAAINERPTGTARPSWVQGTGIYTIGTVNNLYLRANQRIALNSLLGLPAESTQYVQASGNFYLARGHLTARGDGFYAAQQNASFYMQNAAPQWQTFNGFNWYQVEIDVRDYAEASGSEVARSCNSAACMPAISWKVAYNPVTQAGIALIGVNNPYEREFKPICRDVSASIPWFTCRSDLTRGYCYACAISDLRAVVADLSEFPVTSLLT
ncbi:hypothetical protein HUJ04_009910 [Dendroctonus ponderosae]|nr:hypothetical protein HUJ04_009910 [Dendroctonus ponderosae]